ncbi:MAG TPA: glycosyltransferase [Rhizomicrobium sp.]|jgi:glycosyltransferase involved in cell wall biosynthesis|nr:glycosyltransferase [Rhizomicrobium sp.]
MTAPRITAAICTYNRYDLLAKAIASLTRQTLANSDFEILVIDNSPDHRKSKEISVLFLEAPNLRWVIEKTPGLSNARNVATRLANAPFIAFLDDDAIATRNWLEALLTVFAGFGDAAQVVGGRVNPIWEVPRPEWLPDSLLGYASVVNWGGFARFASAGEWVAGTNIAFRVDALKSVGGFPVHLGRKRGGEALLSNDESDVIERMGAKGARLIYAPEAVVDHLVAADRLTQSWFRRRAAWQAVSDYIADAARAFENAPNYWNGVTSYYARLPAQYRTPRGLYLEHQDAEMFQMQITALYNFTIALLAGFRDMDGA